MEVKSRFSSVKRPNSKQVVVAQNWFSDVYWGGHENNHMKVRNIHERILPKAEQVKALIDCLATKEDALWPTDAWPRMIFDRPLEVGAIGGHGPIRYFVEKYEPGNSIRFRFTAPKGFNGWHSYEIGPAEQGHLSLRHTLEMTTSGLAVLSWPLIFRPLHDALIEDSLAGAQAALGQTPTISPWSRWVKCLRWTLSR